ncbi:hypothetical protein [Clostridium sp. BL-8]|uniref:hypothetical protein n=1 Tax=Clostridium sp. BL-8 TaxID=349938 RepID=UPI00098BDEFF|nr:hypothetical protein [Clostridium sp. BL-8]OOM75489.1 hypothetical protein CLOBL_39790 [Clostridium sp. BL-8]
MKYRRKKKLLTNLHNLKKLYSYKRDYEALRSKGVDIKELEVLLSKYAKINENTFERKSELISIEELEVALNRYRRANGMILMKYMEKERNHENTYNEDDDEDDDFPQDPSTYMFSPNSVKNRSNLNKIINNRTKNYIRVSSRRKYLENKIGNEIKRLSIYLQDENKRGL